MGRKSLHELWCCALRQWAWRIVSSWRARTNFVSIRSSNKNPILGFFSSGVQSSKGSRNLSNFFRGFLLPFRGGEQFRWQQRDYPNFTRDISLFLSSFISYYISYYNYVRPFLEWNNMNEETAWDSLFRTRI